MACWTPLPPAAAVPVFDRATLTRHWPRLHAGDAEPLPTGTELFAGWALYHAGQYQQATELGLQIGGAGITLANKAQAVYAHHLERSEQIKHALLVEVAARAEAQRAADPTLPNAAYLGAYALSRYVNAEGMAPGGTADVGSRVRADLEETLRLAPAHADAQLALGALHARVIEQLGSLLGRAQGVSKETSLALFRSALALNPSSPIARVEWAHALLTLEGEKKLADATRLYQEAAQLQPLDATEWLEVQVARAVLTD